MIDRCITPNWDKVPKQVGACVTTRVGGVSLPPYDSFNIASHVGDDPAAVLENREQLTSSLKLPMEPVWLNQVHGSKVLNIDRMNPQFDTPPEADGLFTRMQGVVLGVMTADCLPVFIANREGTKVAVLHGGWRSLAGGIIENAMEEYFSEDTIYAWLGPAISRDHFEVGEEVRETFISKYSALDGAFYPGDKKGKFFMDIYEAARFILSRYQCLGVYGGDLCTFKDPKRFYSYRREQTTGRMASLIWIG